MGISAQIRMGLRLLCLAACLWAGRASTDQLAVELDSFPSLGEPSKGDQAPADPENWAVSGNPKLRPIVLANGTKRAQELPSKPHADTVLQYKQVEASPKENREKAALARRVTVKDKVREIGKPRPKTGVVAPVLQAIGYETVIADFINCGCELPVPGKLPPARELANPLYR